MPESVVSSPVAVTRTRRLTLPIGRPADHLVAGPLLDRFRLAGDHRLVDVRLALLDDAVRGDVRAGSDEHEVALRELVYRDLLGSVLGDALCRVGHQLGQFVERARRASDRSHLDPVAEQEDHDQRHELPEERLADPERDRGDAVDERDRDGE
jgi:hypothetical protein